MPPAIDPVALVSSVAELVRKRDPAGEASPVFDLGTGRRWASARLWDDVELRFWITARRLLGNAVYWDLSGPLPEQMRGEAGPHRIVAENVAEVGVAILSATAGILFRKIIIDAPHDPYVTPENEAEFQFFWTLFARARNIRKELESIAAEKREGYYRQQAFTAAVTLAGGQRMAEIALKIDPDP